MGLGILGFNGGLVGDSDGCEGMGKRFWLGMVSVAGGDSKWYEVLSYGSTIISEFGYTHDHIKIPSGLLKYEKAWFYV